MENLAASSSQQPTQELVQEVTASETRRSNLEATLAHMGSMEDQRPRPIDPKVPLQKVLILDLNGLLLRTCKGVSEAERAKEFGHHRVSPNTRRIIYVSRVGVFGFLEAMARDFTLIIWTLRTSRNTNILLDDMEERGLLLCHFFQTHVSTHSVV
ncbi:hypothetical protein R1flu_026742 [Riccia fluitans]|uniref:FCP1 homology domain-containing protein n=1 Tax=Riccia fluitans TaxID=41844 RepID=A0ABD1XGS1_9MARC